MGATFSLPKRISMAREAHGDVYDYSLWYEGIKAKTIVTTICPHHGKFTHNVDSHCRGVGCPSCKGGVQKSKEERLQQFKEKHGDRYDYSFIPEQLKASTKIEILCWHHGLFTQTVDGHSQGRGCLKCVGKYQFSTSERIDQANIIHGGVYDYPLLPENITLLTRVQIKCPEHGIFEQTLAGHLTGRGCVNCAKSGFKRSEKGYLYFIKAENSVKVGITNKPKQRLWQLGRATPFEWELMAMFECDDGEVVSELERMIHKNTESSGFRGFDGATEWRKLTRELISLLDLPPLYGATLCR